MNLIIRSICSLEEELGVMAWIERVPSQSNPADLMLSIVQNFQQHLRVYNTFPAIDDMDNTSDSEP